MPLYTFACFRVPETICNRMDAATRAFWWVHDQGVRKLHLIHWDKCVQAKKRRGYWAKKVWPYELGHVSKTVLENLY